MNHISLVGRLGQPPELKYFDKGTQVCKIGIAVDNPSNGKDAPPSWFAVEFWGKTAEVCADYCHKGSLIGVEGELTLQSWHDPQGTLRVKPMIHGFRLHLMEKKPQDSPAVQSPAPQPAAVALAGF